MFSNRLALSHLKLIETNSPKKTWLCWKSIKISVSWEDNSQLGLEGWFPLFPLDFSTGLCCCCCCYIPGNDRHECGWEWETSENAAQGSEPLIPVPFTEPRWWWTGLRTPVSAVQFAIHCHRWACTDCLLNARKGGHQYKKGKKMGKTCVLSL